MGLQPNFCVCVCVYIYIYIYVCVCVCVSARACLCVCIASHSSDNWLVCDNNEIQSHPYISLISGYEKDKKCI